MAEQFQPGDMVECVDDTPFPWSARTMPVRGALYTVSQPGTDGRGRPIVHLRELTPERGCGYLSHRFRKVYRPSADLIAKLTAEPVLPEAPKVKRREDA
jgi:hypothetical protein